MKKLLILLTVFLLSGCLQSKPSNIEKNSTNSNAVPAPIDRIAELVKAKQSIAPFFKLMGKPQPTDWLATNKEAGQTFEEYVKSHPVLPTTARQKIYIQPVGSFPAAGREILQQTAEFTRAFYNLPVELLPAKSLEEVPPEFKRKNLYSHQTQVKTSYFLKNLLPQMLPSDAAALICLTDSDLFPENDGSYVFGEASLQNRVGVWSLYRFGKPDKSVKDFQLVLERTLKIAEHEIGHMFSMHHCTKYECLMSGTNNLAETDRRPLDFCPECAAKIAWAMNYKLAERYRNLAKFWARQGQTKLSAEFTAKEKAVSKF